jgi:hypothetical protein
MSHPIAATLHHEHERLQTALAIASAPTLATPSRSGSRKPNKQQADGTGVRYYPQLDPASQFMRLVEIH